MNIYLISQDPNDVDYDTYDSAVVCAADEAQARAVHPSGYVGKWGGEGRLVRTWANSPDSVKVRLIGVAAEGVESGVVLASFNAG